MKKIFRLKNSVIIGSIVQNRIKISNEFYTIYYKKTNDEKKIAFVASKKCGKAHNRNYLKRVMREITRPIFLQLPNIHAVVVVRDKANQLDFEDKKINLLSLYKRLIERLKNEKKL